MHQCREQLRDIIKRAMLRVNKALGEADLGCNLLLQVHDELVFEVCDRDLDAAKLLLGWKWRRRLSSRYLWSLKLEAARVGLKRTNIKLRYF